jgi:integrase
MTDIKLSKRRSRAMHRLSARQVETVTQPGILMDGGGLMLRVTEGGHKKWLFRFASPITGKRREMGLGRADRGYVSLKAARDAAQAARDLLAKKQDPIDETEREKAARAAEARKAAPKTFGQFANEWLDKNEGAFRNAKHRAQWRMTLLKYAAALREKRPAEITTHDVLAVLQPIWQAKPETAKRTQGRIERVLDAARAVGLCSGDNPARWRGHLDTILPSRRKLSRGHHSALPHAELPAFMAQLRQGSGIAARALEFLILTTARSGEVRGMTWAEIDLRGRQWIVPAARMKAGKEHRVPLTDRSIEILNAMAPLRQQNASDTDFVFPGAKDDKPMSDMTLTAVLKRMKRTDITVHGFRSAFRDWAEDVARYPYGAIKAALAHTINDNTDAAYRRGDAYDIRIELMSLWEAYLGSDPVSSKIVPLRRA